MYVELWRGTTCLRTIYNVLKVKSEEHGVLAVTNKIDGSTQFKTYHFKKDYEQFLIVSG